MAENSGTFQRFSSRWHRAEDAALVAAAEVYRSAVKQKLIKGYPTSLGNRGDFVTGNSAAAVTRTDPFTGNGFVRAIKVGTNVLYDLFWELGHHNVFTRAFERVEHWRDAMVESAAEQTTAYARTFKRVLGVS